MKITKVPLAGVLMIEADRFQDTRGHFAETWNKRRYEEAGIPTNFVQDNFSFSRRDALRGLHFQSPYPQDKLVQVLCGSVFDVVVDLRKKSPTFAQWWGTELTEENCKQLYIPRGFAHGFVATRDDSVFLYKCSEFYHPETEHTLVWNDRAVGIRWPLEHPLLSPKDAAGQTLAEWLERTASDEFI